MKTLLLAFALLYVVALHTSVAGMELFGWLFALGGLYLGTRARSQIWARNRTLRWWLGAMLVVVLVSLLINPAEKSFAFQMGFFRWIIVLWGVALGLEVLWSEVFERRLLRLWAVMVGLTGAYGVLQCFQGYDWIRHRDLVAIGNIYRATGFFSESMVYCYCLGLSAAALLLPARSCLGFKVAAGVFVMGSLGVVASLSRGAWLAWMAVVALYLAFNYRRYVLPAVGSFFALTGVLALLNPAFSRMLNAYASDHSQSLRKDIWSSYWLMFLDHPVFGVGLLQGDKFLQTYYDRLGIAPWIEAPDGTFETFYSHAHNNYLQWAAGAGVLGLITYLGVCFVFLRMAWRLRLRAPAWAWSLLLAQVFLHLGGLTEANFIWVSVNHMLVFVWALTLALDTKFKPTMDVDAHGAPSLA